MKKYAAFGLLITAFGLQACAPASQQQRCTGNSLAGAVVGGVLGNQFGGGLGKTVMTAAGAVAGSKVAEANTGC